MAYDQMAFDHRQMCQPVARREIPQNLLEVLSDEEIEICESVELLAFDQAGCRMIQERLQE